MSLDSILISGIRSFGIEKADVQAFKFLQPVTLFLGQNGCGKTTIIEAIRHACTGDLPLNSSSGQGFVSDPNMNHVPEVTAQIKLKLTDARGERATVMRVLKCEKVPRSNSKLKFSTLDATVEYCKPNGQRESFSSRTSDLNLIVTNLLGVPAAILNNVIFCHQEQSLWPLEEGSSIKKKFDDIFDSARYNSCVESLRKISKEKTEELKLLDNEIVHCKFKVDETSRKKQSLQDREEKLVRTTDEIKVKEEALVPIDERLDEVCKLEEELSSLASDQAIKQHELDFTNATMEDLMRHVKNEFEGTDEALEEEIRSFDRNRSKRQQELKDHESKIVECNKSEENLIKMTQKKNNLLVETTKDIETMNGKISERNASIDKLSADIKCTVGSMETKDEANAAIAILKSSLDEENRDIVKTMKENKDTVAGLQRIVDKCKEDAMQTNQEILSKNTDVVELQRETHDIKTKLKNLNVSDAKLRLFENKIANIDKDLEILNSTYNEKALHATIEADKEKIRTSSRQLDELEAELKNWQKNSNIDNELEILDTDILGKESEVEKIKNKYFDQFTELFDELPESEVKKSVEQLQRGHTVGMKAIGSKIDALQKDVITTESEIKFKSRELITAEQELSKSRKRINDLCGADTFLNKSNEMKDKVNKLQRKKGQLSSGKIMYETFIEKINSDRSCPICTTDFKQAAAVKDVVETLQKKIQNIPRELKEVEENLRKNETILEQVTQLKPLNDKLEELDVNMPKLKSSLETLKTNLAGYKEHLSTLRDDIKEPTKKYELCLQVVSAAALIDQHKMDIVKHKNKIDLLRLQLIKVDSSRSKLQTESEIDNIKVDISKLRQNCEDSQKKINMTNKTYQDLREQRNGILQEQLNLQKLMQGKPQLLERLKEVEEKESRLKSSVGLLENQLIEHKSKLEEAEFDRDSVASENDVRLNIKTDENHKHKNLYANIAKLHVEIEACSKQKPLERLELLKKELSSLNSEQKECVDKRKLYQNKLDALKVQLATQEQNFRLLQDNQTLRSNRLLKIAIIADLDKLKQKIGKYNHESIRAEYRKLTTKRQVINDEKHACTGRRKELLQNIKELKAELELNSYKNADLEYRNKLISIAVMKEAIANIKLYQNTLESAICESHKSRMLEINKNIRQLWRHIYRGNDIDYIEIDTEVTYLKSRRNYRYCVMQKKNDTKIEMRGRCSAGQKVLACLIIRIALAESFSSNCGILALDEPTTNLDRENIESLCNCLIRIINYRSSQKNFQLLIITHDEEFLRQLRGIDNLNNFYRVSRNQRGCSIITAEKI